MNESTHHQQSIVVTGADLAPEAQAILSGFKLVYAKSSRRRPFTRCAACPASS